VVWWFGAHRPPLSSIDRLFGCQVFSLTQWVLCVGACVFVVAFEWCLCAVLQNQGAFAGLLSEGLLSEGLLSGGREYDAEEDAAKPIQFNNGGAKRYHYGSHHADIRGSTSLGT
jgi:hypothetical protein